MNEPRPAAPGPRRFRRLPRCEVLGRPVPVASTGPARLLGLAGLPREKAGPGLLLPSCRAIHTVGMRFPIDVFFIDPEGAVVRAVRALRPGRLAWERRACCALELPTRTTRKEPEDAG